MPKPIPKFIIGDMIQTNYPNGGSKWTSVVVTAVLEDQVSQSTIMYTVEPKTNPWNNPIDEAWFRYNPKLQYTQCQNQTRHE